MKRSEKNFMIGSLILLLDLKMSAAVCPAGSVRPPGNGQSWNGTGPQTVYVDSNLPQAVQDSIRGFAQAFASDSGQTINVLPAGSADPGEMTQGAIRFINDPAKSPANFANTTTDTVYLNGVNTNKQVSATVHINLGSTIAGTSALAYNPAQPNASNYVQGVTLHELGHAYGLKDVPVPINSTTNQPDYSLQVRGGSIMNGTLGTNDQAGNRPLALSCGDKAQVMSSQGQPAPPVGGGSGSGSGGGSGGGQYYLCVTTTVEEWNDETYTLTDIDSVSCTLE